MAAMLKFAVTSTLASQFFAVFAHGASRSPKRWMFTPQGDELRARQLDCSAVAGLVAIVDTLPA
jgi:hypothetical protein